MYKVDDIVTVIDPEHSSYGEKVKLININSYIITNNRYNISEIGREGIVEYHPAEMKVVYQVEFDDMSKGNISEEFLSKGDINSGIILKEEYAE